MTTRIGIQGNDNELKISFMKFLINQIQHTSRIQHTVSNSIIESMTELTGIEDYILYQIKDNSNVWNRYKLPLDFMIFIGVPDYNDWDCDLIIEKEEDFQKAFDTIVGVP